MVSRKALLALAGAGALLLGIGGQQSVLAAASTAQTINFGFDPNYRTDGTQGGEFEVTLFTGATAPASGAGVLAPGSVFQTFCLELDEGISGYGPFDWTMSDSAKGGGVGGAVNGADPISAETAYLYTRFWNGNLSSYNFTPGAGRSASAYQLQQAIWYLENEIPTLDSVADAQAIVWVNEAHDVVIAGTWTGIGNVRALNVTDTVIGARQDVLAMIQAPPPPPPTCDNNWGRNCHHDYGNNDGHCRDVRDRNCDETWSRDCNNNWKHDCRSDWSRDCRGDWNRRDCDNTWGRNTGNRWDCEPRNSGGGTCYRPTNRRSGCR